MAAMVLTTQNSRNVSELELPTAPAWVRVAAQAVSRLPAGRYRIAKWLAQYASESFWMRLPATRGKLWFCCDLGDHIARDVCFTGQYEPQETTLVAAILRSGMTFVDVGANWGYFTLLAAHLVGPSGRVVSLEPDPRLFPILQANINRNDLTQIVPLQLAAADKAGSLALSGYSEGAENRGVSHIVSEASPGGVFRVDAEALDAVITRLGLDQIDLLKMDIEGAEGMALAGLDQTLSEKRVHRLLLELHPQQLRQRGILIKHVLDPLLDSGYRGWVVDHSPETTRRACYGNGRCDARSLLRPFDLSAEVDGWPHMLWAAPGKGPLL